MPDLSIGACRTADPDLFFDEEIEKRDLAPPEIMAYCGHCFIKETCLDWAIDSKQKSGMWGGTTPRQREKLVKKATRVSCPGCASQDIFEMPSKEICISCGMSWQI